MKNKTLNRRQFIKLAGSFSAAMAIPLPAAANLKTDAMSTKTDFEAVIVGGSYAGLSAAMALGRSLRKVLIIDSGKPCNRQTPHSHNFITQDGTEPARIAALAKEQVLRYDSVQFWNKSVSSISRISQTFLVSTQDGTSVTSAKILFASGIKDLMPPIQGFAECWGISVLHCPYCHGYEVRKQHLGILADGNTAFEMCRQIQHWADTLSLFTNGASTLSSEQRDYLAKLNIEVVEKEIAELRHTAGALQSIAFRDGSTSPLSALFARVDFEQHCAIPLQLGCKTTEHGHLVVDNLQRTSVEGVFAAGDNTSPARSVSVAIAAGTMAGVALNRELIEDDLKKRVGG